VRLVGTCLLRCTTDNCWYEPPTSLIPVVRRRLNRPESIDGSVQTNSLSVVAPYKQVADEAHQLLGDHFLRQPGLPDNQSHHPCMKNSKRNTSWKKHRAALVLLPAMRPTSALSHHCATAIPRFFRTDSTMRRSLTAYNYPAAV